MILHSFLCHKNTNQSPPSPQAQDQASSQAQARNKRKDANTNIVKWNISPPSATSIWLINGVDVCQTFYFYRNSVKEKFAEMQGYLKIENLLYDLL